MELRPVVKVIDKRKHATAHQPRVQRYRAGRIPDYAKEDNLDSASSDDNEAATDSEKVESEEGQQSSSSGEDSDTKPVDMIALLECLSKDKKRMVSSPEISKNAEIPESDPAVGRSAAHRNVLESKKRETEDRLYIGPERPQKKPKLANSEQ